MASDKERLESIESRLAYQEHAINEMSDVIYRQERAIDRLQQRVNRLLQRMEEMSEALPDAGGHEPPPHY